MIHHDKPCDFLQFLGYVAAYPISDTACSALWQTSFSIAWRNEKALEKGLKHCQWLPQLTPLAEVDAT
jgi:hypothetical protein